MRSSERFISNKFDELSSSFKLLEEENCKLKLENAKLNVQVKEMAERVSGLEKEQV